VGPEPQPERLSTRLTGQFAPVYLTLTSIIQGVALSALASRVEATAPGFGVVEWLLSVTTFLVVVAVWNEYVLQVLAFVWAPTLLDSLVPFAFLAAELFLAHFVYHDLRNWLLALGVVTLIGVVAAVVTETQVGRLPEKNREVGRLLSSQRWVRQRLSVAVVVVCFGAWALYDVAGLGRVQLATALLALGVVVGFVASSIPQWNLLLARARDETQADSQVRNQEIRSGRAQPDKPEHSRRPRRQG
jgi:hypothetical protein